MKLYNLFLRSCINLNYRQFFIVINTNMLFTVSPKLQIVENPPAFQLIRLEKQRN